MADNTGAPWLLPYPEDTDLVRDGASDIEALATAVASGLTAANTGIGTNVVQTLKVDTFSTSSGSFVAVTGLTATITPTKATSKILIIVNVSMSCTTDASVLRLQRTAPSTAVIGSGTAGTSNGFAFQGIGTLQKSGLAVFDSPNTTSAVTYQVEGATDPAGTFFVNRRTADNFQGASSDITLIEVAA